MANALKGEASFVHDGEELTVAMNVGAFLRVEDETGLGIFDMLERSAGSLTIMALLLRAGLIEAGGPKLDREEAATMLMLNDGAREAMKLALERALPKPSAEGDSEGEASDRP